MFKKSRELEMVLAIIVITLLLIFGVMHILKGPYPTEWDDANYAVITFKWITTINEKGIIDGLLYGLQKQLPGQFPPIVFLTSVAGGLIKGTLVVMRFSHLFWYVITLVAIYCIGTRIGGDGAGILSLIVVGLMPPIFYWSQMIMGESALFATVGATLLLLIQWGNRLNVVRAAIFGLVIGLGFLSKQHFLVIIVPPMIIWLFWLLRVFYTESNRYCLKLHTIISFFCSFVILVVPWLYLHYKPFLAYAFQPDFKPHLLGTKVTYETILTQTEILINNVGYVGFTITLLGLLYGIIKSYNVMITGKYDDWQSLAPMLLLSSATLNMLASILLRTSNPRSFAPIFLSLGVLAAICIKNTIINNRGIGICFAGLVLILHITNWAHLCFGYNGPILLKGLFNQRSWAEPRNVAPLGNAVEYLSQILEKQGTIKIKLLGATDIFNPPLVQAIILEKGYKWEASPLYRWSDVDIDKDSLTKKLNEGNILIVQKSGGIGTPMLSKYNSLAFNILNDNPSRFIKIWSMKSDISDNEIEIYKVVVN